MEGHKFEVEKVMESHGILNVRKCKNPVISTAPMDIPLLDYLYL